MVLTGMIASEIAALRVSDVRGGFIHVTRSYTLGIETGTLKTPYRERHIPVTAAISRILDDAIARSQKGVIFRMASGRRFDADDFRKNPWTGALAKSGIAYRKPYTTRHTFAAWSLVAGMSPERLVSLMGHNTKKMVYETYGKYVEGLERDGEKIKCYFGNDFK